MGFKVRLLAVLDSHQLGGHIPIIEFAPIRPPGTMIALVFAGNILVFREN